MNLHALLRRICKAADIAVRRDNGLQRVCESFNRKSAFKETLDFMWINTCFWRLSTFAINSF